MSQIRLKELRKTGRHNPRRAFKGNWCDSKDCFKLGAGFSRISPEYAERLAKYFQVSVGYLLSVSNDKESSRSDLESWITYNTQKEGE